MARVKAMLRRAKPELLSSVLKCGDIELDRETHRVHRKSREVRLGPPNSACWNSSCPRPGRVFSRSQLLDGVWGHDIYVDERTVDVHVGRLRKALNFSNMSDVIRTVRGAATRSKADRPPARSPSPASRAARLAFSPNHSGSRVTRYAPNGGKEWEPLPRSRKPSLAGRAGPLHIPITICASRRKTCRTGLYTSGIARLTP